MDLSGQTFGAYELQAVIARGPRATLYRARQMPIERIVALKMYDESIDPDVVESAYKPVEALTHSHVLPLYEFLVERGLALVSMRNMPVGSMKSRWRGVVPMSDIARVLPQIASALDHAHAHSLLHLNLKPANILIDHPGNAFVSDFGLPVEIGSPYAAPELARARQVDARADVYALGAILYEMLSGRAPVARRVQSDDSANLRMAELPSPRSIRSSIPKEIEAVVLRAMSIDPQARFATPGELALAFEEAHELVADELAASARIPSLRRVVLGLIGLLIVGGVVVALAANGSSSVVPASAITQPPAPTILPTHSSTPAPTDTFTAQPTDTATLRPTSEPTSTPSATGTPTATVTSTPSPEPTASATPIFAVMGFELIPAPVRIDFDNRLELLFDFVIAPPVGGPYGQLYAFLPQIDWLVETRIGAQVSSGTQVLHVTLIVDCESLAEPFTTNQVFLEIRETENGPAQFATSIEYIKTWCG